MLCCKEPDLSADSLWTGSGVTQNVERRKVEMFESLRVTFSLTFHSSFVSVTSDQRRVTVAYTRYIHYVARKQ